MFVLLQVAALTGTAALAHGPTNKIGALAAAEAPSYTIYIRELTAPERTMHVPVAKADVVLDALRTLKRGPDDLARMDVWLVRPVKGARPQVLPIVCRGLMEQGDTTTNFQLLAGDRLFLQARPGQ